MPRTKSLIVQAHVKGMINDIERRRHILSNGRPRNQSKDEWQKDRIPNGSGSVGGSLQAVASESSPTDTPRPYTFAESNCVPSP